MAPGNLYFSDNANNSRPEVLLIQFNDDGTKGVYKVHQGYWAQGDEDALKVGTVRNVRRGSLKNNRGNQCIVIAAKAFYADLALQDLGLPTNVLANPTPLGAADWDASEVLGNPADRLADVLAATSVIETHSTLVSDLFPGNGNHGSPTSAGKVTLMDALHDPNQEGEEVVETKFEKRTLGDFMSFVTTASKNLMSNRAPSGPTRAAILATLKDKKRLKIDANGNYVEKIEIMDRIFADPGASFRTVTSFEWYMTHFLQHASWKDNESWKMFQNEAHPDPDLDGTPALDPGHGSVLLELIGHLKSVVQPASSVKDFREKAIVCQIVKAIQNMGRFLIMAYVAGRPDYGQVDHPVRQQVFQIAFQWGQRLEYLLYRIVHDDMEQIFREVTESNQRHNMMVEKWSKSADLELALGKESSKYSYKALYVYNPILLDRLTKCLQTENGPYTPPTVPKAILNHDPRLADISYRGWNGKGTATPATTAEVIVLDEEDTAPATNSQRLGKGSNKCKTCAECPLCATTRARGKRIRCEKCDTAMEARHLLAAGMGYTHKEYVERSGGLRVNHDVHSKMSQKAKDAFKNGMELIK